MPDASDPTPVSQPISRLGVLGDIHAEDQTLLAALEFFDASGVTDIVSVGDIVTGQGNANRCCEILDKRGIPAVRGNHDRWFLKDDMTDLPYFTSRDQMSGRSELFLEKLPVTREFEVVGGRALLCHGLGWHDMAGIMPDELGKIPLCHSELQKLLLQKRIRFTINGHTHQHLVRRFGHMTILNAGTFRRDHQPCLTLIDFARAKAMFYYVRNLTEFEPWEEIEFDSLADASG